MFLMPENFINCIWWHYAYNYFLDGYNGTQINDFYRFLWKYEHKHQSFSNLGRKHERFLTYLSIDYNSE